MNYSLSNMLSSSGGAFNPLTLSPVVWFDGADANTMFDSTTGGSIVAPGAAIARWEDKSGNARHATQSTVINRPIRTASGQNGKNVVTFDGTNDRMTFGRIDLTAATFFLVIRRTGANVYQQPFQAIQASTTRASIECGLNNDVNFGPILVGSNANSTQMGKGGTLGQNATRILTGKWLGGSTAGAANYQMRVDGAAVTLSNSNSLGAAGGTSSLIGATFSAGNTVSFFGGFICELILCNANLSSTLVSKTETYLSKKWGVTI